MSAEILLVEDDTIDQRFITKALDNASASSTITLAKDGQEALEILRSGYRPSLILLDLNMPRMDGRTLLRTLKSDDAFRKIPVIVLSTSGSASDINDCYDLHANAYVVKPDRRSGYDDIAEGFKRFWLDEARLIKA